ncbi:hypothetical protein [Aquabacterium sp.]|uniref:hypothetical protein n=1 Tax=Aquabacterium sp. TaxID=1872578 RepID=UPI002489F9BC|nr:hypothetical protein [Aquabacterium sp.]MDI1258389.1 hypothetical protein [Aquabacterium sp.]
MHEPPSSHLTWRTLVLSTLALLLVMTAVAGFGAHWAWQNLAAHVVLRDQEASISMPSELAVRASVSNKIEVRIDQSLRLKVPVRETLRIPITDPIPLNVIVETSVPINFDVPIEHTLHVDQVIDLDTKVKTRILGFAVTLPIQGKVPLKADVPIRLVIPVRKQVPVSLNTPALIRLAEPLSARIDTVMNTVVPIRESFSLPVTAPVNATLSFPSQSVKAGLTHMEIKLPLQAVKLERRPEGQP